MRFKKDSTTKTLPARSNKDRQQRPLIIYARKCTKILKTIRNFSLRFSILGISNNSKTVILRIVRLGAQNNILGIIDRNKKVAELKRMTALRISDGGVK